ncbi:MAG: hypothetical protein AAGA99_21175 [Actinomycetota bacterium]
MPDPKLHQVVVPAGTDTVEVWLDELRTVTIDARPDHEAWATLHHRGTGETVTAYWDDDL